MSRGSGDFCVEVWGWDPVHKKDTTENSTFRNFVDGSKYADQADRQADMDTQLSKYRKHSSVMVRAADS